MYVMLLAYSKHSVGRLLTGSTDSLIARVTSCPHLLGTVPSQH